MKELCELGRGGLARVALVQDDAGQQWALKELLPAHRDPKMISRFKNEVRVLSKLRHPNIVPIVAANLESESPHYLMPVADSSLAKDVLLIADKPDLLITIAAQLLDALSYAHGFPLLHRDIKPQNVLRFVNTYKLCDFGLSKAEQIDRTFATSTGEAWTSGWFSPPEQFVGLDHCDSRSDIFSFGRLMLYCLTQRTPSEIPDNIDRRWHYLLSRCIRDDPHKRWPSTMILRQQFELVFSLGDAVTVDSSRLLQTIAAMAQGSDVIDQAAIDSRVMTS